MGPLAPVYGVMRLGGMAMAAATNVRMPLWLHVTVQSTQGLSRGPTNSVDLLRHAR